MAGAVGPAGANASNATQIVRSPTVTIPAFETGSVSAVCPAGKKVTGGGYFASIAVAFANVPVENNQSWALLVDNESSIPVEVWAYAVCL